LPALEKNATQRPSPLITEKRLSPLLCSPPIPALARVVVAVCRSWTNTSLWPFVSPVTRLVAEDSNTTQRPSALIAGPRPAMNTPPLLSPWLWAPPGPTLTPAVTGWAPATSTSGARECDAAAAHRHAHHLDDDMHRGERFACQTHTGDWRSVSRPR
jgi:hypothetical protein